MITWLIILFTSFDYYILTKPKNKNQFTRNEEWKNTENDMQINDFFSRKHVLNQTTE